MAMTEIEINQLAQDIVDQNVAQEIAQAMIKEAIANHKKTKCPHCNKFHTIFYGNVEDVLICKDCGSLFGEGFCFTFPAWARDRRKHFKRWICLHFNIQG